MEAEPKTQIRKGLILANSKPHPEWLVSTLHWEKSDKTTSLIKIKKRESEMKKLKVEF